MDGAIESAKLAVEKCKTALSRSVTARKIADSAKAAAEKATKHASFARTRAEQFDVKLPESRKFDIVIRLLFFTDIIFLFSLTHFFVLSPFCVGPVFVARIYGSAEQPFSAEISFFFTNNITVVAWMNMEI